MKETNSMQCDFKKLVVMSILVLGDNCPCLYLF